MFVLKAVLAGLLAVFQHPIAGVPLDQVNAPSSLNLSSATIQNRTLVAGGKRLDLVLQNSQQDPQIVKLNLAASQAAIRFSLAPSGYARNELVVAPRVDFGQKYSMDFGLFVPKDHQAPQGKQWEIFSQLWQTSCGSPALALEMQPTAATPQGEQAPLRYRLVMRNDATGYAPTSPARVLATGIVPRNQWSHFRLSFSIDPQDPKSNAVGLSQDGKTIPVTLRKQESIGYSHVGLNCIYPVRDSARMKLGIYRGGASWKNQQSLLFDNINFRKVGR